MASQRRSSESKASKDENELNGREGTGRQVDSFPHASPRPKEPKWLVIARMNWWQALLTTTLTVIGGIVGVWLGSMREAKAVPKVKADRVYSLWIAGVECPQNCTESIRVLLNVNDKTQYSYPARRMAVTPPEGRTETFLLPAIDKNALDNNYYISFEGILQENGRLVNLPGCQQYFNVDDDLPLKEPRSCALGPIEIPLPPPSSTKDQVAAPRFFTVHYDIR